MPSQRPDLSAIIARYSDIVVAVGVVAVVGMMVIRIPPSLMDYFIGANLALAVTVLLVALYIPDAKRLPSFPTILLLATLFRLALNVSTTRLILLEANAGDIIFAFGDFVVQGNFVVGAVVFLVLVLIQFMVIAKGSERVAEVSARFTLDAMPGKQMAIDADLRGQLISPTEAKTRREELERESKLYGAMDGAMKFVKGDAIAGIIISVVNIVGGLIVGVVQLGMPVAEAAGTYALLTIGDGLVSQIPALLISVSAGLVVTRVAASSDIDQSNIGRDLWDQIFRQTRPLLLVSGLLLLFGFVPGFPTLVFLVLGAVVGGLAMVRHTAAPTGPGGEHKAAGGRDAEAPAAGPDFAPPRRLKIQFGEGLGEILAPQTHGAGEPAALAAREGAVRDSFRNLTTSLWERLGVRFPQPDRQPAARPLKTSYAILIDEVEAASGMVAPGQVVTLCPVEEARQAGLEAEPFVLPWGRGVASVIPAEQSKQAEAARLMRLRPEGLFGWHLERVLTEYAADFVGVQEVSDMLEALKPAQSELVRAVTPTPLSIDQVTEVIRRLVDEQVSVRDMRRILGVLARLGRDEKEPHRLAEMVRIDMKRALCRGLQVGDAPYSYVTLDLEIEQAIIEVASGTGPPLSLEMLQAIIEGVQAGLSRFQYSRRGRLAVLLHLGRGEARQELRRQLKVQGFWDVAVLSPFEFAPEAPANHIGVIGPPRPEAAPAEATT